mmetsp:Transcript_27190/g.71568  ORF Transcript_27190/g.71568 Transcript_27190/m.71568 type:complete len:330 (+) Transcript_27190:1053-2042(+)
MHHSTAVQTETTSHSGAQLLRGNTRAHEDQRFARGWPHLPTEGSLQMSEEERHLSLHVGTVTQIFKTWNDLNDLTDFLGWQCEARDLLVNVGPNGHLLRHHAPPAEATRCPLHFGRPGGGEEKHLAIGTYLVGNGRHVLLEAEVQHPVTFVEHEEGDQAQAERVVVPHQVQEPPRRRNHEVHVAPVTQRLELLDLRCASIEHHGGEVAELLASTQESVGHRVDLHCQLASRCEHQRERSIRDAPRTRLSRSVHQCRHQEGQRLSRTCGSDANNIAPTKSERKHGALNWLQRAVALSLQSFGKPSWQRLVIRCEARKSARIAQVLASHSR